MRKFTTMLSAVALSVGMLATPALANDLDEHTTLLAAVSQAEEDVRSWEDEVERLEGELEDAEGQLAGAIEARDAQQAVVDDLAEQLQRAEGELADAEAARTELQDVLTAYRSSGTVNPAGGCTNKNGEQVACVEAQAELVSLEQEITTLEPQIAQLEIGLTLAQEELADLAEVVTESQDAVKDLEGDLENAKARLAAAKQQLAVAVAELELHEESSVDEHPGCKGVKNAQEQVSKNGKSNGKSGQTLAEVAGRFGCAA